MRAQPAVGGEAVVDRGRELVLRRQPVVHRDDQRARVLRQPRAEPVMRLEIALHPAAAVEVRDGRATACRRARRVDARGDLAGRPGDADVLDAGQAPAQARPSGRPSSGAAGAARAGAGSSRARGWTSRTRPRSGPWGPWYGRPGGCGSPRGTVARRTRPGSCAPARASDGSSFTPSGPRIQSPHEDPHRSGSRGASSTPGRAGRARDGARRARVRLAVAVRGADRAPCSTPSSASRGRPRATRG